MPLLRRRHLTCFYCGSRSSKAWDGRTRQWLCQKCEAVNYLDENGDICDPPAPETPRAAVKYAQPVNRSSPPLFTAGDENLFCRQCTSNQQLYMQALASYLPQPDDPTYPQFEASYDEYKRNLEQRYPQVCANCAPRVRQRIRQAGYAARTDHLRRMMDKTKFGDLQRNDFAWTWRSILLTIGGFVWWTSLLGQLIWHLMGALSTLLPQKSTDVFEPTLRKCMRSALIVLSIEEPCFELATQWATWTLLAGIPFSWWHKTLRERMLVAGGRIVGLQDYFKLQAVVIFVRIMAWQVLQNQFTLSLPADAFGAAHLMIALFLVITTAISRNLVTIDFKPKFSFAQTIEPDFLTPTAPSSIRAAPATVSSTSSTPQRFPISQLAAAPAPMSAFDLSSSLNEPVSDSETSVELDNDPDNSMDWTPTRAVTTFRSHSANPIAAPKFQPAQPFRSPFYGTLPQAPISPAHALRNPPHHPVFTKTPLDKQTDFFARMMSSGNLGGNTLGGDAAANMPARGEMEIHPGKLHLNEKPVETGLEAMFDSVFSMQDEPPEVRATQGTQNGGQQPTANWNALLIGGLALSALASIGVWVAGNWYGRLFELL